MKTRLNIDIDSNELDEQVKAWLEHKIMHYAKNSVGSVVSEKYAEIIESQIATAIGARDSPYTARENLEKWAKDTVDDVVRRKVVNTIYDNYSDSIRKWIKDAVKEAVETCFVKYDIMSLINEVIKAQLESEAFRVAKEKLRGVFNYEQENNK